MPFLAAKSVLAKCLGISACVSKLSITLKFSASAGVCTGRSVALPPQIITTSISFLYLSLYLIGSLSKKLDINTSNGYYLYDTNNNLINGTSDQWISLEDISPHLINATIAIEDKKFYKHQGFDYLRIAKSLYINIVNRKRSFIYGYFKNQGWS